MILWKDSDATACQVISMAAARSGVDGSKCQMHLQGVVEIQAQRAGKRCGGAGNQSDCARQERRPPSAFCSALYITSTFSSLTFVRISTTRWKMKQPWLLVQHSHTASLAGGDITLAESDSVFAQTRPLKVDEESGTSPSHEDDITQMNGLPRAGISGRGHPTKAICKAKHCSAQPKLMALRTTGQTPWSSAL